MNIHLSVCITSNPRNTERSRPSGRVAPIYSAGSPFGGPRYKKIVFMTTNVSLFKRTFTFAVVAMTILWTVAAGITPLITNAQVSLSSGDLVRGSSFSTVYYYDGNGRYTYPNENIFFSWHTNFNNVMTISDSQLAGIPLEGNVMQRPGSEWIKITSDNKVYAVSPDGVLHWIESEAVASALYGGAGWNTNIQDIADVFFADYSTGASLMSASNLFNGALVSSNGTTYLMWDGALRTVSSAGMSANGLQSKHVLNTTVDVSGLSMGSALNAMSAEISDVSQQAVGDGNVAVGDLTVSVASSTPAGATLPDGATGVSMTTWKFSGSGTVNSVVVNLNGINAASDISNVYLYEGSTRLTDSRSVNSATREATFSNVGWDVSGSGYLTLVAELSTGAAGGETVSFGIASASAIGSTATVGGSFPLNGNTFSLSANDAGTVTITKSGTITNPAIGQNDATISKFKIAAATEGAVISSFRLKVDNAADHDDYRLWNGATQIGTGVFAGSDVVDFTLPSALSIAKGNSDILTVTADVGGQKSDALKVYIDNDADFRAIGSSFGYGMIVVRTTFDGDSCTTTAGDCSYSAVQGGDMTVTMNGPSSGDVGVGAKDVTLMAFTVTASQDLTIKDFPIRVGADDEASPDGDPLDGGTGAAADDADGLYKGTATAEANIQDIKIVDANTGVVLWGPKEVAADTTVALDAIQTLTFTEDLSMTAGQSLDLLITADISTNATSGEVFGVLIDMDGSSGTLTVEDSNGDALTAGTNILPSGDINGNNFTVSTPTLAIALASSPTSFTTVQGTSGVTLAKFTTTAGSASDMLVSGVTFDLYGDDDGSGAFTVGGATNAQVEDFISTCSLYDGAGGLIAGPETPTSSGAALVFDSFAWTIGAGVVENMQVVCNLANPSETTTTFLAVDIDDTAAQVTVEDADGTSRDATADSPNAADDGGAPTVAVTVAAAGSLAVSLDSSSPDEAYLMAGTSDNWVSSFRIEATNEAFTIDTISFDETQGAVDGGAATVYANNVASVGISYTNEAGNTETKTAYMSAGVAKFAGTAIYVNPEQAAVVDVYVNVPMIDRTSGGSATSGERIALSFTNADGSGTENFRAVGIGSGTTLNEGSSGIADVSANMMHIVETYPTIALHASSPSGASVPGNNEVLRFTVSAAGNEDVVLSEIVFKVTTTDNGASNWDYCDSTPGSTTAGLIVPSELSFFDASNTSSDLDNSGADWTMLDTAGNDCDGTTPEQIGFMQLELTTPRVISAGTTKTFILKLDTTGASSSADDAIRIDIPEDPIVAVTAFLTATNVVTTLVNTLADKTFDIASANPFGRGDIVCIEDDTSGSPDCNATNEKVMVQGVSSLDFYVQRGYLGTTADVSIAALSELSYLPSSFVWFDDGDTTPLSTAAEEAVKGSYLVPGLPLTGGTLVF